MFCGKCGAKIEENVEFCTKCGAKLEENDDSVKENTAHNRKKSNRLARIIVVVIIVIAAVIVGSLLLGNKRHKTVVGDNEKESGNVTNEVDNEESNGDDETSLPTGFSTEYTIEDFKDGYFIVAMSTDVYISYETRTYTHDSLLDMNGNEIIPLSVDISFPQSNSAEAVIVCTSRSTKGGTVTDAKIGLMDYSGNEILPIDYFSVSNWGNNSEYYLVEKDGVQSILQMDGTVVKELSGTYDGLMGNSFLIDGTVINSDESIYFSGDLYSLEEELIDTVDTCYYVDYAISDYYCYDGGQSGINLYNSNGDIVLTFPGYENNSDERYGVISGIGVGNILKVEYYPSNHLSPTYYKLINTDQQTVSEQYYRQVVKADDGIIYAQRVDPDTVVDIYDENGDCINSLEISSGFFAIGENNPLIAMVTSDYSNIQFLNAEGEEVIDLVYGENGYINVLPFENYWFIVNNSGEYALMDETGEIRIPFGELGGTVEEYGETGKQLWTEVEIESYNGEEIENMYAYDDIFCIVTTNDSGSNVYFF